MDPDSGIVGSKCTVRNHHGLVLHLQITEITLDVGHIVRGETRATFSMRLLAAWIRFPGIGAKSGT